MFDSFLSSLGTGSEVTGNISVFFLGLIKFLFILASILYVLFAITVVRQVKVMSETLKTSLSPTLKIVGWIHLALAVFVGLLFLVML